MPEHANKLPSKGDSSPFILLLDNFDSFTYNLVHAFGILGAHVRVIRNNALSAAACLALQPDYLVISPGPGNPDQAGISLELIALAAGSIPILGICLGHQCIVQHFGGKVVRSHTPMHGKTSAIFHNQRGIFQGMPQGFQATRYHSLIADNASLPDTLEATAWTSDEEIMGVKHRMLPIEGVQFHPESILTEEGQFLLHNFILQTKENLYDPFPFSHGMRSFHGHSKPLC